MLFMMESVQMIGGYIARLCPDCRNAWHLYAEEQAVVSDYKRVLRRAEMVLALTSGDGIDRTDEMEALSDEATRLSAVLFDMAHAWVSDE